MSRNNPGSVKNFFGYIGRKFLTFLQDLSSLWYLFSETAAQSLLLIGSAGS